MVWVGVVSAQSDENPQESEVAQPEDFSFPSKDGVMVSATYFAGPKSKDTVPVILIHDWRGDRRQMFPLAAYLQEQLGCSVLVPDLRGHGNSTSLQNSDEKIDLTEFKKAEVASAVLDIERSKKFLMNRNNLGELNIELLSIIAVGKTAVHSVRWCVSDWAWAPGPGGLKQGQDVKSICLVGPSDSVEGVSMKQDLKSSLMSGRGMQPLPMQIIWADASSASVSSAKSIYNLVNKPRKKADDAALTMTKINGAGSSPTGLVFDEEVRDGVFDKIAAHLKETVIDKADLFAWQNRSR